MTRPAAVPAPAHETTSTSPPSVSPSAVSSASSSCGLSGSSVSSVSSGFSVSSGGFPGPLRGTDRPLADLFDVALMDLDGVVNRGAAAVPHAAGTIAAAGRRGMRTVYVTNNALRPPAEVAARLRGFGVPAQTEDVVTSAQAAAHVLAERLGTGSRVLITGGRGLRQAVMEEGLVPVDSAEDDPAAVVQGFDPDLTYARLAEAAYAIRAGALWIASNADRTVPTERGVAPGNGSVIAFLRAATDREPVVTGKPESAMHRESMRRSGARIPLIVGDRLDTDIEAGHRTSTPTLLVFTGVTTPGDLLAAPAPHRPDFLAADLRGLLRAAPPVEAVPELGNHAYRCGAWSSRVEEGTLHWSGESYGLGDDASDGDRSGGGHSGGDASDRDMSGDDTWNGDGTDGLDGLRAACATVWSALDSGVAVHAIAARRPPGCEDLMAPAPRAPEPVALA
ncbi:putative sugar phosphatase of HAD superfamily [Frankia sp. CcI6]|uniref:HAD-IIA family hydrolase n=1 Tax=Frankia TaxID=1854 RepID=UPI0003CFDD73|nr:MULTISPECIES: HAD-IIA family hydrolase [Frankia]ESZ99846.1 putative sugar phosphatase of HAD superfamily [Frankia sp. CcI6]OAA18292.1 haloacid dehalogenase subfamily IIA protein [Frankia casuarinae]